MPTRFVLMFPAALLALPFPAHAHAIHPLWVVGALSPLVVLLLTVLLGWLARLVLAALAYRIGTVLRCPLSTITNSRNTSFSPLLALR